MKQYLTLCDCACSSITGALAAAQAVSLGRFATDLGAVLAIDWLLDRCRTAINLLSDSLGVVLIDHLIKSQPVQGADPHSLPAAQLELALGRGGSACQNV